MRYSEAKAGRVFIIRLEDGDIIHERLEAFAREKKISAASLIAVGGADAGSVFVTGPAEGRSSPVVPMETSLDNVHEVTGTGTIFPDGAGNPALHMHMACGRKSETVTGCVRRGVRVWHVLEVVLYEITGSKAARLKDAATGFELLDPLGRK
jgi:predicted DNA-binding protein with PD1-like motif